VARNAEDKLLRQQSSPQAEGMRVGCINRGCWLHSIDTVEHLPSWDQYSTPNCIGETEAMVSSLTFVSDGCAELAG
jgi:hypothetical protein